MKTKFGYIAIDNGYVTWYFREGAEVSLTDGLDVLEGLCIFKLDNVLGEVLYSDWHHVRTVPAMVTQLKREKVCARKNLPLEQIEHHENKCPEMGVDYLRD